MFFFFFQFSYCSFLHRMIQNNKKEDICPLGYWNPSRDHPELLTETNENGEPIAELLRNELYWYAKSNMALVNVYIKVMRQIILTNVINNSILFRKFTT